MHFSWHLASRFNWLKIWLFLPAALNDIALSDIIPILHLEESFFHPIGTGEYMAQRFEKGICGICPAGCGVEVAFEGDCIAEIHPWKEHPQGKPCLRGQHAPEIIYSKDRLKKPLKRKGPEGTLVFEEVSWDQALDEIARTILKLKDRHGPQCIASFLGRGNFE
jgi:anaerobic selenocysteine-containing dehydrogenase